MKRSVWAKSQAAIDLVWLPSARRILWVLAICELILLHHPSARLETFSVNRRNKKSRLKPVFDIYKTKTKRSSNKSTRLADSLLRKRWPRTQGAYMRCLWRVTTRRSSIALKATKVWSNRERRLSRRARASMPSSCLTIVKKLFSKVNRNNKSTCSTYRRRKTLTSCSIKGKPKLWNNRFKESNHRNIF